MGLICWAGGAVAQKPARSVHYRPQGTDFVCENGQQRFNRALYGGNTAFRVEAGDLPEFAMYLPGMGGNLHFGLMSGKESKWLIDAEHIRAVYRPGKMLYAIKDPLLGKGVMQIEVLALYDAEGMIVKIAGKDVDSRVELMWVYGGVSGKKFSRNGDIGADPESSFYLHAANCKGNAYTIKGNTFQLTYGGGKQLSGMFPNVKIGDASKMESPVDAYGATTAEAPVVTGKAVIIAEERYFLLLNKPADVAEGGYALRQNKPANTTEGGYALHLNKPADTAEKRYSLLSGKQVITSKDLPHIFNNADKTRHQLANRIKLQTPDPYLNTLGGALSLAADAIWEDPTFLHGAVAWRMRLNAWRGAYVADPLGWHDRARKHFSSYALSQVTTPPETGVVMDTALHLARHQEKIGTFLFSDGYICRNPNGDIRAHHYDMNLVFIDQLLRHFNWTGDTAYVREMWPVIKRHLAWEKRNFDSDNDGLYDAYAAIWASDALQYSGGGVTHTSAYNYFANKTAASLAKLIGEDGARYEKEAQHILSSIQKYLWLPEQGWYAEYKDKAGRQLVHPAPGLWTIYHAIDSRVPDDFQAYRSLQYIEDHIPRIPVQAKGFSEKDLYLLSTSDWQPYTWSINNVALAENLHTALAYWQGNRSNEAFRLWRSALLESMYLSASPGGFQQLSYYDAVRGELYRDFADPIGMAARSLVEGLFGIQPDALHDTLMIRPGFPADWEHARLEIPDMTFAFNRKGDTDRYLISPSFRKKLQLKLLLAARKDDVASASVNGKPVRYAVRAGVGAPLIELALPAEAKYEIVLQWKGRPVKTSEQVSGVRQELSSTTTGRPAGAAAPAAGESRRNTEASVVSGSNVSFRKVKQGIFTWWQPIVHKAKKDTTSIPPPVITPATTFEKVPVVFNDKVTNIFKQAYLSPRPVMPTLQLPVQGIGNWCYPLTMASIDDSGLRTAAGARNEIRTASGIPFSTPSDTLQKNILFTSQWDNYPELATIALSGKATYLCLLMAGTTNPMQSRMTNGFVIVAYTDGSRDSMRLKNPQNWWPIEQDYFTDGHAFTTDAPHPERLYLKEGRFAKGLDKYAVIKGFSSRGIDGGAATVLHMPLQADKTLRSLTVQAYTNDVVIGLMAATLLRQ
ncbi:DUF4450 domain-containing protein [Chitinophaga cymbidii]|uniref:DUF4450 domain-containing protein n=1 Tax=Chitinophaga cymbidii TaxID=1096750 RepID=UPI001C9B119C|nr:DUF4450 domain-containing protein [Chitinophaga cymbidii]